MANDVTITVKGRDQGVLTDEQSQLIQRNVER